MITRSPQARPSRAGCSAAASPRPGSATGPAAAPTSLRPNAWSPISPGNTSDMACACESVSPPLAIIFRHGRSCPGHPYVDGPLPARSEAMNGERLLALICPACWCGRMRPLAQMGSADRVPNTFATWNEALDGRGFSRPSDQPITRLFVLLQASGRTPDVRPAYVDGPLPARSEAMNGERLLALICPACWCGRMRPLAQMGSADRVPNTFATWNEALDGRGFSRPSDQPITRLFVLLQASGRTPDVRPAYVDGPLPARSEAMNGERLLALICPACWCGRMRPLAQMGSADRV